MATLLLTSPLLVVVALLLWKPINERIQRRALLKRWGYLLNIDRRFMESDESYRKRLSRFYVRSR